MPEGDLSHFVIAAPARRRTNYSKGTAAAAEIASLTALTKLANSQPQAARRVERSDSKTGRGFAQSDNARAGVEIKSRRIIGQHVTTEPNDKEHLVSTLASIPATLGRTEAALNDSGYYSAAEVARAEVARPTWSKERRQRIG